MADILVAGLINIETTLRIPGFPLEYNPVNYPFFGVDSSVSGVGYNLARALTVLGDRVDFLSLIGGRDMAGPLVRSALARDGIDDSHVLSAIDQTAQSVILYDPQGRRQIHTDLKDIQEQAYPGEVFEGAMAARQVLALCNINFTRPFLARARQMGKTVATDVHAIADLDDEYNRDFMRQADILFMSDERLTQPPEQVAREAIARYQNEVVVIGLGEQGCLLAVRADHMIERIPAVHTRPVKNTIGAGDALFSAFLHATANGQDPYTAIRSAVVFASYKIGAVSAADGFLNAGELDHLVEQVYGGGGDQSINR
jgi:sugar/nucleoside kinase (ribokinase family)